MILKFFMDYIRFNEELELKHTETTLQEIADKHNIRVEYLEKILDIAIEIETEHSDDKDTAETVAKAHLFENPLYYDDKLGLPNMERELDGINKKEIKAITNEKL